MKTLTLIRHGETLENKSHHVQGQDPTRGRLTARGMEQAERLGQRLAEDTFDVAYCSPLERAVLTLAPILRAGKRLRTLPLKFPPALREINLGSLEGKPHALWQESIEQDPIFHRPPGGESWQDLYHRVQVFLQVLLESPHARILIVAHGGVNRSLIACLTGTSMQAAWEGPGKGILQDNTCLNTLVLCPEGNLLSARVNDTLHLEGHSPNASAGQVWEPEKRSWKLLDARAASSHFLERA